ncbi:hypothetical protein C7253_16185 [Mycobacterium tuberculosis]|nr:hypothetical protein C7253_16185 [Mycobacterium tuberculosis]
MPIASAALAPGAAGRHHRAKCRSQARRLRRARRVGTIGLVPIASAALAPGAAGRRARRVGTIGLVPIASAALAPGAAGRHHRAKCRSQARR